MNDDPALPLAVQMIAGFEGFRSAPYRDGGGIWTIGYGCTFLPNGARVTGTTAPLTESQGRDLLRVMTIPVLSRVRMMVHRPITDMQAAALTSLAYNIGTGALAKSTLMRLLNECDYTHAREQFGAWVHDHRGNVEDGLVKRRKAEAEAFAAGTASAVVKA